MRRPVALVVVSALMVACGPTADSPDSTGTTSFSTTGSTVTGSTVADPAPLITDASSDSLPAERVAQLVAERPYNIFVPSSYSADAAMPLVLMLHGYTGDSTTIEAFFQFKAVAEERGFIYILPEGTANESGEQFWNATDACCGAGSTVDDSTYLRAVIDDISSKLNVDSDRVYIIGYSNGGFMAHRMACDHADAIAAIISIAGATFLDPDDCAPTEPVSVVQVHAPNDSVIYFGGGTFMEPFAYPSAMQTAQTWSSYIDCRGDGDDTPFDLDPLLAGDEAIVLSFGPCANDTDVELWVVEGGGHGPVPASAGHILIDFLYAHAKA